MSKKETIPPEIKEVVEKIVEDFNKNVLKNGYQYYQIRYKGRFLYLDLSDNGRLGPICRLEYTGKIDKWKFAIFEYSSERYNSQEWFFPGSNFVDGTVKGAMRAGLEAYQ